MQRGRACCPTRTEAWTSHVLCDEMRVPSLPRGTRVGPTSRNLPGSDTPHRPALSAAATACQGRRREGSVPFPGASFKRPGPSPGPAALHPEALRALAGPGDYFVALGLDAAAHQD